MSILAQSRASAIVPVKDMDRSRSWWVDTLGLKLVFEGEGGMMVEAGDGTRILLYPSEGAGKAPNTVVDFAVTDISKAVDSLVELGLTFERYEGIDADERCIAEMGPMRCAWVLDPDGNCIAISQLVGATA